MELPVDNSVIHRGDFAELVAEETIRPIPYVAKHVNIKGR
jgi:hypothetical protein